MRHVDIDEVRRILDETPAPEPPAQWSGAHVGERMIEAFRILDRLPEAVYPRQYRSTLAFLCDLGRDFADAVTAEATRDKRAFSWGRIRPSPAEISRMERAFDWPGHYLKGDDLACGALLAWAQAKVRNRFPHWFLNRHGLSHPQFAVLRRRAAYTIAVGLACDRVPIE